MSEIEHVSAEQTIADGVPYLKFDNTSFLNTNSFQHPPFQRINQAGLNIIRHIQVHPFRQNKNLQAESDSIFFRSISKDPNAPLSHYYYYDPWVGGYHGTRFFPLPNVPEQWKPSEPELTSSFFKYGSFKGKSSLKDNNGNNDESYYDSELSAAPKPYKKGRFFKNVYVELIEFVRDGKGSADDFIAARQERWNPKVRLAQDGYDVEDMKKFGGVVPLEEEIVDTTGSSKSVCPLEQSRLIFCLSKNQGALKNGRMQCLDVLSDFKSCAESWRIAQKELYGGY